MAVRALLLPGVAAALVMHAPTHPMHLANRHALAHATHSLARDRLSTLPVPERALLLLLRMLFVAQGCQRQHQDKER